MPHVFPLTGISQCFIPTITNHFCEDIINDLVDETLYNRLVKKSPGYPAVITMNSFVNEFEPEIAVNLINKFCENNKKRIRSEYFHEFYCRAKIIRQFMNLKPTCFLVLGIPCEKRYRMGQTFAEKIGRVHINVNDLINDEIAKRTDIGKWIYTNLKMKKDIPINLVTQLLKKAVQRDDVLYRGYVLTDYPIIPLHEFTEARLPMKFDEMDSLREPSIKKCQQWLRERRGIVKNPAEKELNNEVGEEGDASEKTEGFTVSETESEPESDFDVDNFGEYEPMSTVQRDSDSDASEFDPEHDLILHEIANSPQLKNHAGNYDIAECVRRQFDTLLRLNYPPDLVIYIRHCEDGDSCNPKPPKGPSCETEGVGIYDKSDLDSLISDTYSYSGSDLSEDNDDKDTVNLQRSIRYRNIRSEMEHFILHYPKDSVIKIDSRFTIAEAVDQFEKRLLFINYKLIHVPKIVFSDGMTAAQSRKFFGLSLSNKLEEICRLNPIIPNIFWLKSCYGTFCPVKMMEGKMVEGKAIFAVQFMGYIYLLSSFHAMKKFYRNPRKYFFCEPSCRVAIVGSRATQVSSLMKSILNCTEYDWKVYLKTAQLRYPDMYLQAREWAETIAQKIDEKTLLIHEEARRETLTHWSLTFRSAIEKLLGLLGEEYISEEVIDALDLLNEIGIDTNDLKLKEKLRAILDDDIIRTQYVPNYLKPSNKQRMDQTEIVENLTITKFSKLCKLQHPEQLATDIANWIRDQDRKALLDKNSKRKYGRWLIPDAPADLRFWKRLKALNCLPDVTFFLENDHETSIDQIFGNSANDLEDTHHITSYIISNFPLLFQESDMSPKASIAKHRSKFKRKRNSLDKILNQLRNDLVDQEIPSEALEKYLKMHKVIVLQQDMTEDSYEGPGATITEQYLQLFKSSSKVLTEEEVTKLYEVDEELDKMVPKVSFGQNARFYTYFNLRLRYTRHIPEACQDLTQEDNNVDEEFDIDALSEKNMQNVIQRETLKHIQFGNTRKYCPVTYYHHNSLLFGQSEYTVEYANQHFMMSSAEARDEFLRHPFKYAHDCLEPVVPPFRACVIGPLVDDCTNFAAHLARHMKVESGSFSFMITEFLERHRLSLKVIHKSEEEIYELYCDEFLSTFLAEYFKNGFIIAGFPTSKKQFQDMIRHKIFPEFIIVFDATSEEIMRNLFNYAKAVLDQRLNMEAEEYRRRIIRTAEMEEVNERISQKSKYEDDYVELDKDSQMEDDRLSDDSIETIINPPPTEEQYAEMLKALEEKSCRNFIRHVDGIKNVVKISVENNILVIEIPSNKKRKDIAYKDLFYNVLNLEKRKRIFTAVHIAPVEPVHKLLDSGHCIYSHFKNFDPVDASTLVPINLHEAMRKNNKLYACIYRKLVYFLNGYTNLVKFCSNPRFYAKQENPFSLVTPMRIAVMGPPKSGTTTLCKRISKEYNMTVLNEDEINEYIKLRFNSSTVLADPNSNHSKIILESMHLFRNCSSNGFVLDNFPITPEDVIEIAKNDVALNLIIVINASFQSIWRNLKCSYTTGGPISTYVNVLDELCKLHAVYSRAKSALSEFLCNKRDIRLFNVVVLNRTGSKWSQWEDARSAISVGLRHIGSYYKNLMADSCVGLSHINIFWHEFEARLSPIKLFCPVCLKIERKLKQHRYDYIMVDEEFYSRGCQSEFSKPFGYNSNELYEKYKFPKWYHWNLEQKPLKGKDLFRTNLIQYREHFYWACDRHLLDLVLNTRRYLPVDKNDLPLYVPFLVTSYFAIHIEHEGNCVVNYSTTRTLEHGSQEFPVYYRAKIFLCANAANAKNFLENPEHYYDYRTLVPINPVINWDLKDLQIDYGRLTPNVLIEALLALADERPKHFALDIEKSAAIYIALHLKTVNPISSANVTKLYEQVMSKYLSECSMILSFVYEYQKKGNPYIKGPQNAEQDFNFNS